MSKTLLTKSTPTVHRRLTFTPHLKQSHASACAKPKPSTIPMASGNGGDIPPNYIRGAYMSNDNNRSNARENTYTRELLREILEKVVRCIYRKHLIFENLAKGSIRISMSKELQRRVVDLLHTYFEGRVSKSLIARVVSMSIVASPRTVMKNVTIDPIVSFLCSHIKSMLTRADKSVFMNIELLRLKL